jgi:acetoin utilization protein AcuB
MGVLRLAGSLRVTSQSRRAFDAEADEEGSMKKSSGDPGKVRSWMSSPARTIKPLDTAARARQLLEEYRINQLAVVEGDRLVGVVTDRDLRDAFPSVIDVIRNEARSGRRTFTRPEEVSVEMVMTANPLTLGPEESLSAAARLLRRERIGAVPIVENHRVVGILTRSDLLDALLSALERPAA